MVENRVGIVQWLWVCHKWVNIQRSVIMICVLLSIIAGVSASIDEYFLLQVN